MSSQKLNRDFQRESMYVFLIVPLKIDFVRTLTFKSHSERITEVKTRYVSLRQLLMGFAGR